LSPTGLNLIIVLNSDGQATPSAIFVVSPAGAVLDNSLPGFSIYPSPVHDAMTIKGSFERATNVEISVTNVRGEQVMQWSERQVSGQFHRQIDMSSLPSGAYIVEIKDGTERNAQRRMVQKIMKF